MQSLILEILQAQPSLRDSKTYLNSFGPRLPKKAQDSKHKNKAGDLPFPYSPSGAHLPLHAPPPLPPSLSKRTGKPASPAASHSSEQNVKEQLSFEYLQTPEAESSQAVAPEADSHHFAQPDMAVRNAPDSALSRTNLEAPITPATQAVLNETLSSPPVQQHTALVKVQGPFSSRQLESIAEGMVYLKRLGLVSVIVMDNEESTWDSVASVFSKKNGSRIESEAENDIEGLKPWIKEDQAAHSDFLRSSSVGKVQEGLRKEMLSQVTTLAELLTEKGAPARPFPHAMMRVDAEAVHKLDAEYPPHFEGTATSSRQYQWGSNRDSSVIDRSPLVSDDNLSSLRTVLSHDMIPVIAPLALYDDPCASGAPRTVCVRANDVLVGLAREMAAEGQDLEKQTEEHSDSPFGAVDMMPLRLMVINREGGIPSHARGGNPHLSINLASEYSHIMHSFIWNKSNPTALSNLSMVRDCLAYMPHTSSGVVVSHRSPKSLIANLITNKAAHSPSLPHRLLAGRKDVRHTPTIIRPGLPIRVISDYDGVDWDKVTELLENSFRRKLNREAYFARMKRSLDFVIVMGDYQGAAIVTHEYAPGESHIMHESIAYLDKFAVLPSLQGSGAVDFLWGALRDEVHGLGLLDALNDNGGKGGFGVGRDLVWKSRRDNPVNRWYYERSNGFLRIDTSPKSEKVQHEQTSAKPAWSIFWADAEQRIAIMSGERRLGAEASADDILESANEKAHRLRQSRFIPDEDDDDLIYRQDWRPSRMTKDLRDDHLPGYAKHDRLDELNPTDGNTQRLLPVIAPDEQGRLDRWARCMATIPSAWL